MSNALELRLYAHYSALKKQIIKSQNHILTLIAGLLNKKNLAL